MNLIRFREDKEKERGERVLYYFKGREYTNLEMMRASRKLASALRELGVRHGDRIILQMPNTIEVIVGFWAIWRLGAVIVPINHLMPEEEIAHIYRDSGAKLVISSPEFLPKIDACRAKAPELQTVILIGDGVPVGQLSYNDIVGGSAELREIAETADDDNAALIYTAGTTGPSKGVIHTHQSLYVNSRMSYESYDAPDGYTAISVLPLCHSFGIASMNIGLFRALNAVLIQSFNIDDIFSSIEKYRAWAITCVPTMYVFMLLYPEPKKYDLGSMRLWLSGGAPLALETWKKFREVYGFEIIEGWGLTEAGANNTINPVFGPRKPGSIGVPMKGQEMAVFDENGKPLPAGEEGEIVIRGPQIMKGYWNRPEETAAMIRDGWLYTGDMGRIDEDGYYWITGRKKDLIIKGAENISPRKIEEVIHKHPGVSEAAVIGVPDRVYGEDIKAFVVMMPGKQATPEEIVNFCKTELSNFLLPKEVVFLPALPRSLPGKVLKKELRKMS